MNLYNAYSHGDSNKVKYILKDKSININRKINIFTSFQCALTNKHLNIVKILMKDERLNINAEDIYGVLYI